MENYLKNIPESVKLTINSVLPLIIVLILFLIVGKFGIAKVVEVRSQTIQVEKDQNVLKQKLTLLQSINDTLATGSSAAVAALPANNPSLVVVSQLKNLSISNGVSISGIKAGAETLDPSGLSKVSINFIVAGNRPSVISFLTSIETIAPITLIDKIKMNEGSGQTIANVSVKSFWSALPKTLPDLNQPITDLTAAEKKTLIEVSGLVQPVFEEVTPTEGGGKSDPFSK